VSVVIRHRWLIALVSIVAIIGIGVSLVWSSIRPPLINVDGSLVEARVLGHGSMNTVRSAPKQSAGVDPLETLELSDCGHPKVRQRTFGYVTFSTERSPTSIR
jgi:hypothetical protein